MNIDNLDALKDESIKDTLIDMANYALIALILYEEELEKDRVGRVHEWNATHSSNATSNTMLHATGVDPKWVSYEWNQKSNLKE